MLLQSMLKFMRTGSFMGEAIDRRRQDVQNRVRGLVVPMRGHGYKACRRCFKVGEFDTLIPDSSCLLRGSCVFHRIA